MPFDMRWHETLPVLIITYQDELTPAEYGRLCDQRTAMLDDAQNNIIVVANMLDFTGFPEARKLEYSQNIVQHHNVQGQIIVAPVEIFKRLSRAVVMDYEARLAVYFVQDLDHALDAVGFLVH